MIKLSANSYNNCIINSDIHSLYFQQQLGRILFKKEYATNHINTKSIHLKKQWKPGNRNISPHTRNMQQVVEKILLWQLHQYNPVEWSSLTEKAKEYAAKFLDIY